MKPLAIVLSCIAFIVAAVLVVMRTSDAQAGSTVVVYKSATCACCSKWVDHMEEAGFTVETHDVDDVNAVKVEHGVTRQLASCHTALVDGYVLEGHVPAQDVVRLLAEKPAVLGLTVPAMPLGTPGMEMPDASSHQDYDVLTFDGQGKTEVYRHVKANS